MKEILTFVDTMTSEGTDVAEVTDEVKQDLVSVDVVAETEMKEEDNVLQMVRQLNRVGTSMREQCKLITNLREHSGLPQLHKDHIRFQPLFKKRASWGFFRQ